MREFVFYETSTQGKVNFHILKLAINKVDDSNHTMLEGEYFNYPTYKF